MIGVINQARSVLFNQSTFQAMDTSRKERLIEMVVSACQELGKEYAGLSFVCSLQRLAMASVGLARIVATHNERKQTAETSSADCNAEAKEVSTKADSSGKTYHHIMVPAFV